MKAANRMTAETCYLEIVADDCVCCNAIVVIRHILCNYVCLWAMFSFLHCQNCTPVTPDSSPKCLLVRLPASQSSDCYCI